MKNTKEIFDRKYLFSDGNELTISSFFKEFNYVVLYFYPSDSTPGCTIQSKKYSLLLEDFKKNKTIIIGVSKGEISSKHKFINNCNLKQLLIVDSDLYIVKKLELLKEKSMFGKKFNYIIRSSFIFDKDFNIISKKLKVKPISDASDNLEFIRNKNVQ